MFFLLLLTIKFGNKRFTHKCNHIFSPPEAWLWCSQNCDLYVTKNVLHVNKYILFWIMIWYSWSIYGNNFLFLTIPLFPGKCWYILPHCIVVEGNLNFGVYRMLTCSWLMYVCSLQLILANTSNIWLPLLAASLKWPINLFCNLWITSLSAPVTS